MFRIVALSDTHGYHKQLQVPDGDLLIHAGDLGMRTKAYEVVEFARWFNSLPHPNKIVIAGNHDMACEGRNRLWTCETFAPTIYLDHESCEVNGYRIFGSPYTSSVYEPSPWFFDYPRYGERSKSLWAQIPKNLDILITHGPPYMIRDLVPEPNPGEDPHVGDANLLARVRKTLPRLHIFGHIHEGHGHSENDLFTTQFYNVSVCDGAYRPVNPITVIEI